MTPEQFLVRMERAITPRPDCRLWFTGLTVDGYGRIGINGSRVRVHRLVYELKVGPIPEGMTIDHLCRIRNCINPDHMELVTHEENAARGGARSRGPHLADGLLTHCVNGHEYTPENTGLKATARGQVRKCLTCRRNQRVQENERRRAKRPAA